MEKTTEDGLGVTALFGLLPTTAYGISLLLFVISTFILLPALLIVMKHVIKEEKILSGPVLALLAGGGLSLVAGILIQP